MKRYNTQLVWKGKTENEIGIVSAIDKTVIARNEVTRQSQSASTESQSVNQPASAKSNFDEDGSINQSVFIQNQPLRRQDAKRKYKLNLNPNSKANKFIGMIPMGRQKRFELL